MKFRLTLRLPLLSLTVLLVLAFGCDGILQAQQGYSGYPAPGYPQSNDSQIAPQYAPQYPPQNPQQYGAPQAADQDYAQPDSYANQQGPQQAPQQAPQQPLNTEQLEQLVAPIALYPDTLVAQILAAATYPAQVVDADHWRQAQGNADPNAIVYGANAQSWDPSLKALTAFPQVLGEMDQNIRWTIALGNAYYNQPQDVLDVVQVMRQRAQAAGNLQTTPQEAVSYDQGYIQVAPVNPEVVYLPAYDPWTAYGQPIQPYRGFSFFGALGSFFNSGFGSGLVRFGSGIAMNAFSHSPFGLLGWGLDWLTHSLLFHNSNYYSHSTTVADWGLPHGGPRAYGRDLGREWAGGRQLSAGNRDQNWDRGRLQSGRAPSPPFAHPEPQMNENRPVAGGFRNNPAPGNGFGQQENRFGSRPGMQAYDRTQQPMARPQQPRTQPFAQSYNRPYGGVAPGNGAGFYGAQRGGFAGRPAPVFNAPQQAYREQGNREQDYRGAAPSFPRGDSGRGLSGYSGSRGYEGYSGKEPKSGGFHPFGGGGHEPKAPKAPKAPRAPKMEHSFGGGGHGGGREGGRSGGHGGGGHHR